MALAQHPHRFPKVVWAPLGLCDGRVMDKGIGYNAYPEDCTKYVQCFQQGNTYRSVIRPCPFGTFWDQNAVTCSNAANVICRNDLCRTMPDYVIYAHSGPGCRPHWMCLGQRSLPQCCPAGSRFIDKVGCIVDPMCMESCMSHHHENHTSAECMLKTHADKKFYLETIAGFGEIARPCAPGSIFSEKQCTCISAPDLNLHSQGELSYASVTFHSTNALTFFHFHFSSMAAEDN
ncbi:hypothetical protein LOTGIDRAFT_173138 [Lottia gigantea]|uniref:Chitin-binding type-2 domain-containing protein n=1 Tax=Lottia gigantea TaxID=225164 RepID=V4CFH4_LOTGI|nr:hypothetical protein LOTGIDRAFT_173138 [Lottia gigantea]ESP00775.1 hypothetical protein LOTGIDRAFT_173138 [Lottia gigantea]